ncbi:hypothetical protein F5877DRAFT_85892 [Lentinula edodes]|nr:hypothetical protein F5877DRAFT_85892 [Lentinula edodes]
MMKEAEVEKPEDCSNQNPEEEEDKDESEEMQIDKTPQALFLPDGDEDENESSLLVDTSNDLFIASARNTSSSPHSLEVIRTEVSQASVGDGRPKTRGALGDLMSYLAWQGNSSIIEKTSAFSLSDDAGASATDTLTSEAALSRVISKEDFKEIEKKSGIERQLEESLLHDLIIVDQHAANEKYNFETLQQTTNIAKLPTPRPLELTASDELVALVALENLDVLRLNGFELKVVSDAQEDIGMVDDNP